MSADAVNDPGDSYAAVPVVVDGQKVYLSVRALPESPTSGDESEVSSHRPTLEQALDGLAGIAQVMGTRLRRADASRTTVTFGCEFALESGTFVAMIGKATAKSSFTVSLEWEKPTT